LRITRLSSIPGSRISAGSNGRIFPAQIERLSGLKGCYTLTISLRKKLSLRIGSLGRARFPSGIYLYTGSALNGLRIRLSRHLRKGNKRCHWHIDCFLKCPQACVQEIWLYPGAGRRECYVNQRVATLPGAKIFVNGFGVSDCNAGCKSHLIYFSQKPTSRFQAAASSSS
jgi:sugar fermentation stimulation protein A